MHIKVIIITAAIKQKVSPELVQDRPPINDEEGGTFEGFIQIHLFHPEVLKGQPDGLKRMLRINSVS